MNEDGKLHDVHISGDFFFYPVENLPELEHFLEGVQADDGSVAGTVAEFYARQKVDTPGV